MNLKAGQGFVISSGIRSQYGLILNITDENVEYVSVKEIVDRNNIQTLCYDDPNAVYATHKDNVRLSDCPPPFSNLSYPSKDGSDKRINNAYAVADMSNVKSISKMYFDTNLCEIIDNGVRISGKDMQTVKHHSWPKQMQKEKSYREVPEFNDEEQNDLNFSVHS